MDRSQSSDFHWDQVAVKDDRAFWGVLYLHVGGGYMDEYIHKIWIIYILKIAHFMYVVPQLKKKTRRIDQKSEKQLNLPIFSHSATKQFSLSNTVNKLEVDSLEL